MRLSGLIINKILGNEIPNICHEQGGGLAPSLNPTHSKEAQTEAPPEREASPSPSARDSGDFTKEASDAGPPSPVALTSRLRPSINVASQLDGKQAQQEGGLDWRHSIVDLMQLLDLDSSYQARVNLAFELGYSQKELDEKGAAAMDRWLHRRVLQSVANNGGDVPAELLV